MPEIEIELSAELLRAIKENRGELSVSEFIEQGMRASMNPKITLDRKRILRERT